jgi:hypothetical protein
MFWLYFSLRTLHAIQNINSHHNIPPENITDPFFDYFSSACYSLQPVVSCDVTTLNILNPFPPQHYDTDNMLLQEIRV